MAGTTSVVMRDCTPLRAFESFEDALADTREIYTAPQWAEGPITEIGFKSDPTPRRFVRWVQQTTDDGYALESGESRVQISIHEIPRY